MKWNWKTAVFTMYIFPQHVCIAWMRRAFHPAPVGCLSKDSETGFTVYDNTNCIGCKSCAMACPFGAPRYRKSDGKMVKCDGCNIRVKNGLEPACVKSCTFGALTCVPEDEFRAGGSKQACNVLIDQLHLRKK